MSRLPRSVVGDAYASTNAREFLADLVDVRNRMAGQEGEAAGAAVVVDALEAAGARDVGTDEFDIDGWWRGDAAVETSGAHEDRYDLSHEVIALPGTPAGTGAGDLVDVGYGRPEDFEAADLDGKVAMASSETPSDYGRWIHRMEKYVGAVDAGAEAFVFRNHIEGSLPPTGEVGYDNRPGPIPAVGVSKELGARLRRHAEDDVAVAVEVDCRNEPATSRNVSGDLGPDTDEVVLVTAHHDSHDIAEGANDNGAGCALVVEVARLLAQVEEDLDTRVRCMTFGSEEIGLQGAAHAASVLDLDDVRCVLNADGAGRARRLSVGTNASPALESLFTGVAEDLAVPLSTDDVVTPHGDQWAFVQEGVPGVMVSSTNPDKSGRGWGHTHADTLDKVDGRDLRAHAAFLAETAVRAADAGADFGHRSREEVRDLVDEGYEKELRMGGRWPYDD
jgi:Zn-dependent M28 family amino/carboxypeptidase